MSSANRTHAPVDTNRRVRRQGPVDALVGLLAAALAVGVGQLVASVTRPADSPVFAVGAAFIDATPVWLKDFAIRTFGTADKAVLLITIGVALTVVAVVAGVVSRRRPVVASLLVAGIGGVGALAAVTRPGSHALAALPSVSGALAGIVALRFMSTRRSRQTDSGSPVGPASAEIPAGTDVSRRGFVLAAGGVAALAAISGGIGSVVTSARSGVESARAALKLPVAKELAPKLPASVSTGAPGSSPFVVPNADFYRVDTNLVVPTVDPATWTLRVGGMVKAPYEITFDELLAMPMVERYVSLTCVSNEVGGQYAGNAKWLGVRLKDILDRAGVDPAADQLLATAVDGWTCGSPMKVALDGRDALVCVGMNGEPLPAEHGFPARVVIPGLFGFVSATKWLVALEATTYAQQQSYWTERGWATDAPIRTMARIETPAPLSSVPGGKVAIAGTAWAQHRGVDGVEVQVDDGPWQVAKLASVPSIDTWRQWVYAWDASPGQHTLRARATDLTGKTQPAERLTPFPSGAQGWHEIVVTVA